MKKLLLSLGILLGCASAIMAQVEMSMGYMYGDARGIMGTKIDGIHGLNMDAYFNLKETNLAFGVELGICTYGSEESEQYYEFDNATSMLAPVSVVNNVFNTGLLVRYELFPDAALRPYAVGRAGMSRFSTNLSIEDPREIHTDKCPQPLETETLAADVSWTTGAGVGLRYDLGTIFKGLGRNSLFFDISANYSKGTIVDYMSVDPPSGTFVTGENVESVNFLFANEAHPEIIHEYHTGYLYRTPLELMNYRFALSYKFN
jgi:hypothetical protein